MGTRILIDLGPNSVSAPSRAIRGDVTTSDDYDLKARAAPAFVSIFPTVLSFYLLVPQFRSVLRGITLLCASLFVSLLFAYVARRVGSAKENALFKQWVGRPTTIMLRHRDSTIDPLTKARYHAFLSGRTGLAFPSASQEQADPTSADLAYESAGRWLREYTRDRHLFPRVRLDNIGYGFSRNLWGLKPWAFALTLVTLVIDGAYELADHRSSGGLPIVAVGVAVVWALVWLVAITPSFVQTAAFAYARALLSVCEKVSP